jgi:ADP-heptose:LPS heptosyltransferase
LSATAHDIRAAREKNPGPKARRVCVIKLSALGDFMLALGAMKAVREFHPRAQITLLTTPPFREFAERCPFVDVVETDGRPDGIKATREMVRRLSAANYDLVYDFQTSSGGRTNNYFKFMKPKPLWSGIAPGCAFPHDNPGRADMHTIERLGEQLHVAGLYRVSGPDYDIDPPMPDLSWVSDTLGHPPRLKPEYFGLKRPYMLLIPGASEHRAAKRWPLEEYVALATAIRHAGITPAVIGGKAEAEIAQKLARAVPGLQNLVTRTDLFQISTLAAEAEFVVGNDTGPMHMATLTGAPGIALFATTESRIDHARPRGAHVTVMHAPTLDEVRALGVPGFASGVFDVLKAMALIENRAERTETGAATAAGA